MFRYEQIPKDTFVVPSARPVFLEGDRQDAAVLFLHGYTGQSADFLFLAQRLNALGLTVHVPRLPGHGTNRNDFRRTGWRDWLRRSIDAYLDLRSRYGEIYLGGLSMGGLLAIILAAQFPVARLALFAPALAVAHPMIRWTPILRYLVPPFSVSPKEEYDDPGLQHLAVHYWNERRPVQIASVQRLITIARHSLHEITAPVLTIVSEADQTVPSLAADLVEHRVRSEILRTVRLERSGHVVTAGIEKERVATEIIRWFVPASDFRPDEGYPNDDDTQSNNPG
ncbi:MAG: alpha/beta hydrolase [Alkalispirochaeta sp.]